VSVGAASAAQIADAVKITIRAVNKRAQNDGWTYENVNGNGSIRREYIISALPGEIQKKVIEKMENISATISNDMIPTLAPEVSDTTLGKWKNDSRIPTDSVDNWDKLRRARIENRLKVDYNSFSINDQFEKTTCRSCKVPDEICHFFNNNPEIYLKYSEIKKLKQELTAKKRIERKTASSELKDSYVKKTIKKQTGLEYSEITQEIVALKREMLLFHRELKKVKEEVGNGPS